jgi:tol-pal system protein YbgF
VSTRTYRRSLLLGVILAGCATRADLVRQDRQLRGIVQDQRRQLESVQRELERLRGDVEEGGGGGRRAGGGGGGGDDRIKELEDRVAMLERQLGHPAAVPPEGEATAPIPPTTLPPVARPAPPAVSPPVEEDPWRREVAREQAAAGAINVPERAEYLALLDGLAKGDCAKLVPQLNGFAASHKESPLADDALYWSGRCYQRLKRPDDAISKFYEVGTRYPKSDKAPAALWNQANLFLEMGNSPDARIVFSKLIKDYPASDEAARARQKLSELQN